MLSQKQYTQTLPTVQKREPVFSHTFSFITHLKALFLAPRLWLTIYVLGMKSLLFTYQFFGNLNLSALDLKEKYVLKKASTR